ncbi:ARF GTPase-activating protein GIT2-like isoform X2 [Clytia hemisphaerica]|uniref:Arf-GAP domain-containing protein n=1 Tax=Clytia hemisphaerica TaxID=252671 RepID=A0A7M5UZB8_9CNID
MSLARMKQRTGSDICADCSSPNPDWASINRGVLICDECCSVHRSLGRHISQVRHLRLAPWNPSLLAMTQNLVSNGANLIWEHSLTDSSSSKTGIRKPNPKDPVHPIKSNFIKAKYEMLAFVHRLPNTDDRLSIQDLSKQLYSSVRTGNLETSLRLISLGAQPNYFHPEKGNTPLHVAAASGQATQCELLIVHGADPSAFDVNEKTAAKNAMENGHTDLCFRLVELAYELTDRLTFYLCGRRPDHKNGINYLIPALQDRGIVESSAAQEARCKLQSLNNRLFEELCSDIYDEVDRRENDAVWLATQHHRKLVSDHTAVPFLPVNPGFSSTRNQGRQKLARFNAIEFATLIVDLLHDAKNREGLNTENQSAGVVEKSQKIEGPIEDDNDHDYDDPNGEEDKDDYDVPTEDAYKPVVEPPPHLRGPDYKPKEIVEGKDRDLQAKVHELQDQKHSLGQEINLLRSMVQKLMQENAGLRAQIAQVMVERDDLEQRLNMVQYDRPTNNNMSLEALSLQLSSQSFSMVGDSNYDNVSYKNPSPPVMSSHDLNVDSSEDSTAYRTEDDIEIPSGPSQSQIVMATEQITKKIQELLQAAQGGQNSKYVECSSNISAAVTDMANLFPESPPSENVRMALRLMITSAARLQVECKSRSLDQAMLTQQVIQCSYDIAKAAKQLVTTYNESQAQAAAAAQGQSHAVSGN